MDNLTVGLRESTKPRSQLRGNQVLLPHSGATHIQAEAPLYRDGAGAFVLHSTPFDISWGGRITSRLPVCFPLSACLARHTSHVSITSSSPPVSGSTPPPHLISLLPSAQSPAAWPDIQPRSQLSPLWLRPARHHSLSALSLRLPEPSHPQ
ncbi:unnamed protein product [Pleuronectes platessa]|uniref:Uncharacterized protein n=1 Tax=Pleuronectes platessa TaxID=8262 RepID=A0A9N7VTE2_PLEPL|nr:unnamed protein product [Pleuronectes platessa]